MNTREIAEEIAKYAEVEYPWDRTVQDIQSILDRHLEGKAIVPREPTLPSKEQIEAALALLSVIAAAEKP